MLDQTREREGVGVDYVEFVVAGTAVVGAYHCSECGYGVMVHAELPPCPMCSGTTWEQHDWSPFTKSSSR
jgi:rubrerythrin